MKLMSEIQFFINHGYVPRKTNTMMKNGDVTDSIEFLADCDIAEGGFG